MGRAHVGGNAPLSYVDSLKAADRDVAPRLATGAPVYRLLAAPCYAHENLEAGIGEVGISKMGNGVDRLTRDIAGKAPVKLVIFTMTIAIACAMVSPASRNSPMFGRIMDAIGGDMKKMLPDTLDKVTEALKRT
jgi:hypothetical protein